MGIQPDTVARPSRLLDQALAGATNDEALELAYTLLDDLADRAEKAADIAIDSGDRDAENEALTFCAEVDEMLPNLVWSNERLTAAGTKARHAKQDVEVAIRNRRALGRGASKVEQFSRCRNARVIDARAAQRRREQAESDQLLERAQITLERVAGAVESLDGSDFKALDVTLALMPELRDTSIAGRQSVINRVSQQMQRLVKDGRLVKRDLREGARTHTYTRPERTLATAEMSA